MPRLPIRDARRGRVIDAWDLIVPRDDPDDDAYWRDQLDQMFSQLEDAGTESTIPIAA